MILTPLQKLPNNVSNLGKVIVATGFEFLPKKQKIAQSGHTGCIVASLLYYIAAVFHWLQFNFLSWTQIVGKGRLWVTSFIYKYKTYTTYPLYDTMQCFY